MAHELRDELEAVIRGWNAYEIGRGAAPIIDYDLRPDISEAVPIASRLEAYERCVDVLHRADAAADTHVADRARADATYLSALLGARIPIERYIADTQGCHVAKWPEHYLDTIRVLACTAIDDLGISWSGSTKEQLRQQCGPIAPEVAPLQIRQAARDFEPLVRQLTGSTASYRLSIEAAEVDAYWHYWVDGAGEEVRLRLNVARARFTRIGCLQFALHEVLGHGLQATSVARFTFDHDVPWIRLFSVHAPQQMLLEGLAQALPAAVAPDDKLLMACVRLDHYLQLVRSNLHLAINRGESIERCVAYARRRVPFWTDEEISDTLTDRVVSPLLRTYLWSYGVGVDWFIALIESGTRAPEVLRAAYQHPLRPVDLEQLWPEGPRLTRAREDPMSSSA